MNERKFFVSLFFLILFLQFASADVVSVNNGGNIDLVINPDNYIEGFFSCVPTTCAILGYNCDNWDDKCGGIINCGTCSSGFTCTSGVCTSTPTPPTPPTPPSGGGGAGGIEIPGISISPPSINLTLSYNNVTRMAQRYTQKIFITNNAGSSKTLSIGQNGLDSIAFLGTTSIIVGPGETQELDVDFVAPLEERNFAGNILIDGYNVPVFIHVTSNPLWFDSNIVVLNKDYKVSRGGTLKTQVELIPMGEKSRLDVTLNYVIKDYSGKIFLTKSETVLVTDKMNFERDFGTGSLPLGQYIIALDLIYPGGVAPSSAHFEVVPISAGNLLGIILFFLIFAIIIIAIIIIIILIRRKRKERKENN